uniref:Uncharacterized protein n=1 Tax=Panagrolaimus sp. JU765 TaxID=591449 RepID=A0AC34R7U7_9BILA
MEPGDQERDEELLDIFDEISEIEREGKEVKEVRHEDFDAPEDIEFLPTKEDYYNPDVFFFSVGPLINFKALNAEIRRRQAEQGLPLSEPYKEDKNSRKVTKLELYVLYKEKLLRRLEKAKKERDERLGINKANPTSSN